MVANDVDTEWDDSCPGLVETLAKEAEWEAHEVHNDAEAARWAVDPPDGWRSTPPESPVHCQGTPEYIFIYSLFILLLVFTCI
jgi:hypothetical protein